MQLHHIAALGCEACASAPTAIITTLPLSCHFAGFTEGRIKHVPSNQDLLKHMSAAVGVRVRYVRSASTNSLSSLAHVKTRNPSLGDLTSVLESPAAHQVRPQPSAAAAVAATPQAAGAGAGFAEQQQWLPELPSGQQQAAADVGCAAGESAVLAAGAAAAATAEGVLGGAAATQQPEPGEAGATVTAVERDLALEVPSQLPGQQETAAISITAESSAVVVPAGGGSGGGSSGSAGSSFSEVEAAASSEAGHDLVSM